MRRLSKRGARTTGFGLKKARRRRWRIVLIDESGFMLQPVVRRTWAPKGETPIQHSWDRHDRLSVIAAITLPPLHRRLGLYFQVHDHNICFEEVMAFLYLLHHHLRRKFILVMDRYSAHRKAVRLLQEAGVGWFEVEWLPGYAPDLNPVEMLWNHTKYADLANFIPDDVGHLLQAVNVSIANTRQNGHLIHSFFKYAGLEL
jgi:tRNA U34 5-methylaminomethyl-2-thiouridine-forming methyltransferase MnmC